MNWTDISHLIVMIILVIGYELRIKALKQMQKEHEKAWGNCCYTCGYIDGKNGNKPQPKTQEDVIAEIKGKQ